MVNYYLYARDFSGSTGGIPYFRENGLATLKSFKKDVEDDSSIDPKEKKIAYLHWDSCCIEVDEKTIVENYEKEVGNGGTEPVSIIRWIKKTLKPDDQIKLLYLITDGCINRGDAENCVALNADQKYDKVVFHGINKNQQAIDLSVCASFLKNKCIIYCNMNVTDTVDISEPYDYDSIAIDNFQEQKENLKSFIKLKFLSSKKHDLLVLEEIEKLKSLKNRLQKQLQVKLEESNSQINKKLNTKDKETFLNEFKKTIFYKSLSDITCDLKVDIEQSVTTLINYINKDHKSFRFDTVKFLTNYRKPVAEESVIDVNFSNAEEIEFPDILLADEKGIPVISLTELNLLEKIILHVPSDKSTSTSADTSVVPPASFEKFKKMTNCPIHLLQDPDLPNSIGYYYTLTAFKLLLTQSTSRLEPRTRRVFHGGLVLLEEFDKYNDYILSATYFNSKKVDFNVGLFYYVLWKICEQKEYMDRNVVEQFKKYMLRRITNCLCPIALSSLPLDPTEKVYLPSALWYCVELSSCLFKDDEKYFNFERLRLFYGIAHHMIEILQFLDYKLDKKLIYRRIDIIRNVNVIKKLSPRKEKVYYLLKKIFKEDDGFLISEFKNVENIKKLNYLNLNHREILKDNVLLDPVDLNEYVFFLYRDTFYDNNKSLVKMCDQTFRPYFVTDDNSSFYSKYLEYLEEVTASEEKGLVFKKAKALNFNKILSLYNLYVKYVKKNKKFPTLEEYTQFVLKRKKFNKQLITIFPTYVNSSIKQVHSLYESVVVGFDPRNFIKITNNSANRMVRVKTEENDAFTDDEEIEKFIVNEETKVKCKEEKERNDRELKEGRKQRQQRFRSKLSPLKRHRAKRGRR